MRLSKKELIKLGKKKREEREAYAEKYDRTMRLYGQTPEQVKAEERKIENEFRAKQDRFKKEREIAELTEFVKECDRKIKAYDEKLEKLEKKEFQQKLTQAMSQTEKKKDQLIDEMLKQTQNLIEETEK